MNLYETILRKQKDLTQDEIEQELLMQKLKADYKDRRWPDWVEELLDNQKG
jgi:hypothetical protein